MTTLLGVGFQICKLLVAAFLIQPTSAHSGFSRARPIVVPLNLETGIVGDDSANLFLQKHMGALSRNRIRFP
jgi:hypothetical protein